MNMIEMQNTIIRIFGFEHINTIDFFRLCELVEAEEVSEDILKEFFEILLDSYTIS